MSNAHIFRAYDRSQAFLIGCTMPRTAGLVAAEARGEELTISLSDYVLARMAAEQARRQEEVTRG